MKKTSKNKLAENSSDLRIFNAPKSKARKVADIKMQNYLKSGFSILLLGERGTGKTHLAEKYKLEDQKFVSVNCASFTDNTLAESILFGHEKGAFTDAGKIRQGIFEQADGGILFFDEIHSLDKITQARMMKAIETDQNNKFSIRRIGSEKIMKTESRLIFASNRTIEELRNFLLPDFFDRIAQLVIELPPLRHAGSDISGDFEAIWYQMRFDEFYKFSDYPAKDRLLFDWLKTLSLFGNYRDLQKIAIYYKVFLDTDFTERKMLEHKTALEFTQNQFERYISPKSSTINDFLESDDAPDIIVKRFKKQLACRLIAKHGNAQSVAAFYKKQGNAITDKTLYNWKNMR